MNRKRKPFEKYYSEYKLKKGWVFPYGEVERCSSIVLYGAGDVGQSYYEQLCANNYCVVSAWVDKAFDIYRGYGLNVESPIVLNNLTYDYIVIAVSDIGVARGINNSLLDMGVDQKKIIWIGEQGARYKNDVKKTRVVEPSMLMAKKLLVRRNINIDSAFAMDYLEQLETDALCETKLVIPRIVFELTTYCTLKCKHCNNLINEYKNPKHVPLETVLSDIDKVADAADVIVNAELIGGEPFVYPYFAKALERLIAAENVCSIEITTNGTLVPPEDALELLSDRKITVKISKYELSGKNDELTKIFFERGINFEVLEEKRWVDSGKAISRNRNDDQIRAIFHRCISSYICKTVHNGKLFACARAASLFDLGVDPNLEYVDLNGDALKDKIRAFYLKTESKACDYCDAADDWRVINAGEQ